MVDLIFDIQDGIKLSHLVHEILLWFIALVGAIYQFRIIEWQNKKLVGYQQEILDLNALNENLKKEQANFKKKISHISDEFLGHLEEQFDQWSFSRGEKEIALLLIKGLTMKEIADIRGSNENTVRQQASQIYKKSSLKGRMELSAFFLDDLLSISKLR